MDDPGAKQKWKDRWGPGNREGETGGAAKEEINAEGEKPSGGRCSGTRCGGKESLAFSRQSKDTGKENF